MVLSALLPDHQSALSPPAQVAARGAQCASAAQDDVAQLQLEGRDAGGWKQAHHGAVVVERGREGARLRELRLVPLDVLW